MPALTIKGIPEMLLQKLRRHAKENRRSMNAEVIHLLELTLSSAPAAGPLEGQVREQPVRMGKATAGEAGGDAPGDDGEPIETGVPAGMEEYVARKVAGGLYESPTEMIREGLRLLIERDRVLEIRLRHLSEQLAEGLEQARSGDLIDGEEVFAGIRRRSEERRRAQ